MNSARAIASAFRHFRAQRMRLFEQTFAVSDGTTVLDVGGSPEIWAFARTKPRLTIFNLPSALRSGGDAELVGGDARMLPFADQSFDIVFSNSVIEHVGTQEDQQRFANEIARVGRRYFVQTPNRRFPIELHLMMPLVHFLPKRAQKALVSRFTVWERLVKPSEAQREFYIEHFLHELNLLDARRLQQLFPAAKIAHERVAGLTKSIIAVK